MSNVPADSQPLFYNKRRESLSRLGISYILDKYTDMARKSNPNDIPPIVTPHCFRHSKAMHLLQSGVNLVYIRDVLGHSKIKTTEGYARADSSMKRKALINASRPEVIDDIPVWQQDSELLSWLQNLGRK